MNPRTVTVICFTALSLGSYSAIIADNVTVPGSGILIDFDTGQPQGPHFLDPGVETSVRVLLGSSSPAFPVPPCDFVGLFILNLQNNTGDLKWSFFCENGVVWADDFDDPDSYFASVCPPNALGVISFGGPNLVHFPQYGTWLHVATMTVTAEETGEVVLSFAGELGTCFDVYFPLEGNVTFVVPDIVEYDSDGDGINNEFDNCPNRSNPDQGDFDLDGIGDICELRVLHGGTPCASVGTDFDGISYGHSFSGYIDPRQESSNGVTLNRGMNDVNFVFSESVRGLGGTQLTPQSFTISQTGELAPPTITNVYTPDHKTLFVQLNRPISVQEWTTIVARVENDRGIPIDNYGNLGPGIDEPDRIDVAFLPSDIDQNSIVNPLDLVRLKQIVNGLYVPPMGERADYADINRSGAVTPLDLFRFKQLINGISPATRAWASATMNHPQP